MPALPRDGTRTYAKAGELAPNTFSLGGAWRVDGESATAVSRSTLDARYIAKKVYLVMSSRGGRPRSVQVIQDGKPVGRVTVTGERLYRLIAGSRAGEHLLSLRFPPGVTGYAFTFG